MSNSNIHWQGDKPIDTTIHPLRAPLKLVVMRGTFHVVSIPLPEGLLTEIRATIKPKEKNQ
jgi:hypothetical protein